MTSDKLSPGWSFSDIGRQGKASGSTLRCDRANFKLPLRVRIFPFQLLIEKRVHEMRAELSFLPRAHWVAGTTGGVLGRWWVLPSSLPHPEKLRAGTIVFILSMRTLSVSAGPRTVPGSHTRAFSTLQWLLLRPILALFISFPLCYLVQRGHYPSHHRHSPGAL